MPQTWRAPLAQSPAHNRQLVRALTLIPAAAVILANIIGTGVFVKSRVMICNVGTPGMVLTVWLVSGILTLAGALVYALRAPEHRFEPGVFGPGTYTLRVEQGGCVDETVAEARKR